MAGQRTIAVLCCVLTTVFVAALNPLPATATTPLAEFEAELRQTYSDVKHLDPMQFAEMINGGAELGARSADVLRGALDLVVVDVREEAEYAVSHLPGAIRVDPDVWNATFLSKIGDLRGKTLVLYCSIGVRSSKLARRIQGAATRMGAVAVYNLSGGIFRWHNEQRPLVRVSRPTKTVHPYDRYWSRFVARDELIRYSPAPGSAADNHRADRTTR